MQCLLSGGQSPLIDLIINDQVNVQVQISNSLDPEFNKEAINLFEQSQSLLEDRKFFAGISKSTQVDLGIFKEHQHPSFQVH